MERRIERKLDLVLVAKRGGRWIFLAPDGAHYLTRALRIACPGAAGTPD